MPIIAPSSWKKFANRRADPSLLLSAVAKKSTTHCLTAGGIGDSGQVMFLDDMSSCCAVRTAWIVSTAKDLNKMRIHHGRARVSGELMKTPTPDLPSPNKACLDGAMPTNQV